MTSTGTAGAGRSEIKVAPAVTSVLAVSRQDAVVVGAEQIQELDLQVVIRQLQHQQQQQQHQQHQHQQHTQQQLEQHPAWLLTAFAHQAAISAIEEKLTRQQNINQQLTSLIVDLYQQQGAMERRMTRQEQDNMADAHLKQQQQIWQQRAATFERF
jgi:uncharacterized protein (DUF2141 family)